MIGAYYCQQIRTINIQSSINLEKKKLKIEISFLLYFLKKNNKTTTKLNFEQFSTII